MLLVADDTEVVDGVVKDAKKNSITLEATEDAD